MKKKVKIIIGAVCSLLGLVILTPFIYYFVLTQKIILDGMPTSNIQEQIEIYEELGYCTSGYTDGEDIEIRLTRQQRQKWIKHVQDEMEYLLEEANGLDNMTFEMSRDINELTLNANENVSFKSMASYLLALVYDMQLYQVLNGEEDWRIDFILRDMDTKEILYTAVLPEDKIKFDEGIWK